MVTMEAPPKPATPTERAIAEMLIEDTGSHFLDSGIYGRAWQRTRAEFGLDSGLPNSSWDGSPRSHEDPGMDDIERIARAMRDGEHGSIDSMGTVYVDTFHWLVDRLDYVETYQRKWRGWSNFEDHVLTKLHGKWSDERHSWLQQVEAFLERLGRRAKVSGGPYGDGEAEWINTYNGECELDRTLQFLVFHVESRDLDREAFLPDGSYVFLQIHGGADVRGGYTAPRLFTVHGADDLFDYDHIEIYCAGVEEDIVPDGQIAGQITMEAEVLEPVHVSRHHAWDNGYGDGHLYLVYADEVDLDYRSPDKTEQVLCLPWSEVDREAYEDGVAVIDEGYTTPEGKVIRPRKLGIANVATYDHEAEVWRCPFDASPLHVMGQVVG